MLGRGAAAVTSVFWPLSFSGASSSCAISISACLFFSKLLNFFSFDTSV
jgi:hypothetical protein